MVPVTWIKKGAKIMQKQLTIKLESNPNLPVTWKSEITFHTYTKVYYQRIEMKLSYTTLHFYIHYDEVHNNPWSLWCSPETHKDLWSDLIDHVDQEILDHGKPFDNYGQIQGWLVHQAYSLEEARYTDDNYDPEVA
jgi:hypothetical protein